MHKKEENKRMVAETITWRRGGYRCWDDQCKASGGSRHWENQRRALVTRLLFGGRRNLWWSRIICCGSEAIFHDIPSFDG